MTFSTAVQNTQFETTTTNGMKAYTTSCDNVVNLFYSIGASRGKDIIPAFEKAFQEDQVLAIKVALWARDIRGGAGERQLFKNILVYLEQSHPEMLEKLIPHISEYGRWDDLLIFSTPVFKERAYGLIRSALACGNTLVGKWLPREKSAKKGIAQELRKFLKMSPKTYRKMLVEATNVVENKMCAKNWSDINFSHVPSVAAGRYQKAFGRNAPEEYQTYKNGLVTGETKINASAVYPHNVVQSLNQGDQDVAIAQWEALPNFMTGGNIIGVIDVSGSMTCPVGGNPSLTCMDVAIGLGLYMADKNTGPFKDVFLTFSERSEIQVLKGNLAEKYLQMSRSDWGMSTSLDSAFDAILKVGIDNKLTDEEMPEIILILSDMQFNPTRGTSGSALEMIKEKYASAGYTVPNVVWWNLNDYGNVPVRFDEKGTALISGFSPAILKSVLAAEEFTPLTIMMDTIGSERYNIDLS